MATLNTETTQKTPQKSNRNTTPNQALHPGGTAVQQRQQQETAGPVVTPLVDVYENEAEFLLVMDLPDVPSDGVGLELNNRQLTLRATQATPARRSFRPRTFQRTFQLPDTVDLDRIEAHLDGGVLKVKLTKREDTRPRRIQIQGP